MLKRSNPNQVKRRLGRLKGVLERAFGPDTSLDGYTNDLPSAGQCAAVALVVQRLLGGSLVSAQVQGHSHWFNRVALLGRDFDVDLTGDQFGHESVRVADVGRLYAQTRTRQASDVHRETLNRADRLT